jgi:hypothetical protein
MNEAITRPPRPPRIESRAELKAMSTDALHLLEGDFEREITIVLGGLEADPHSDWARRARQAMRFLRLNKAWISEELAARKKASKAEAAQKQVEALKAMADARRANAQREIETNRATKKQQARIDRMAASTAENERHIAVFKEVAREVLGDEMYMHIWELTRRRLEVPA